MLLVRAIVILSVLAVSGPARADDCATSVEVNGDRDLVRDVTRDLRKRGVAVESASGCPIVTARLSHRGEMVVLEVSDSYGRSRSWEVRDVSTASALVESWTRQEIDDSELPPEPAAAEEPVVPATVVATAPEPTPEIAETAAAPARASSGLRGAASLALEGGAGGDAAWYGGTVAGCVRLGPMCAGGRVRGEVSRPTHHEMTAIDLLVVAELPIARFGFVLAPAATLGVGWTRVTSDDPHAVASADVGGLRAGGQLSIARPVGLGLSIELLVSADAVVVGHTDTSALPRGVARLGLGLRYGGR